MLPDTSRPLTPCQSRTTPGFGCSRGRVARLLRVRGSHSLPPLERRSPTPDGAIADLTVVGATPLPGLELDASRVPAPVQTATGARSTAAARSTSTAFMNRRARRRLRQRDPGQSVSARHQLSRLHRVAAARHAAGPLGLHGRRAPQPAVRRRRELGSDSARRDRRRSTLMPGSNPLFGLNTLGGALSIQTKDGFDAPGHVACRRIYGSDGARAVEFETRRQRGERARTGTSPATSSRRTAGATTRPPTCRPAVRQARLAALATPTCR